MGTSAAQRYQQKLKHFTQIMKAQQSHSMVAEKSVRAAKAKVVQLHKRLLAASADADKAWRHQKLAEEEQASWKSQAANALDASEKGLLKERAKGATLKLAKASEAAKAKRKDMATVEVALTNMETKLRQHSRSVFQHDTRAKA